MSYMYYSVFGSIVTVVVGCVVSLLTKTKAYDSALVHPLVSRFVKSKDELKEVEISVSEKELQKV